MKTESDGFKIFEHCDRFDDCIREMYNNEILLRDQIRGAAERDRRAEEADL